MNELMEVVFKLTMLGLYIAMIAPILGYAALPKNGNPNWIGRSYERCVQRGLKITIYAGIFCLCAYSIYLVNFKAQ